MPVNAEQSKQEIALELENARLLGSPYLPVIISFTTLAFTIEFFPDKPPLRVIFGIVIMLIVIFLFVYRAQCFRNARKLIEKL